MTRHEIFLRPVYAGFSEGFDTPDLVEANSLLQKLSHRDGTAAMRCNDLEERANVQANVHWSAGRAPHSCSLADPRLLPTELTIFWAEWDPANYLQELVNEYEQETGVKVTVETTAWPGFQTKAFAEFNAKGDAYDMVVGDSQWLGAGSTGGHYVDLTDFFAKHDVAKLMAPATVKFYAEYPGNSGKYWAIPLEGDAIGWAYRKDWFEDPKEMAAFKAKYGYDLAVPKTFKEMRDIAEFFYRPDQNKIRHRHLHRQLPTTGWQDGFESVLFSYGGELGDYATYKVDGIINSDKAIAALDAYKELYKFTPPGWASATFVEDNQAITENLAAMSMNFFAFFPSLINEASNPNAKVHRFLRQPGRPERRPVRRAWRTGHLDRLLFAEAGRGLQVPGVVHQGRDSEEVGRARRLHLQRSGAEVGRVPERHAVQQGLLRDHVQGEGLLGGSGERGTAAAVQPARLSVRDRRPGHGQRDA